MAKVCGPTMVESLGLGGAWPCASRWEAANKRQLRTMERFFTINSTLIYGFAGEYRQCLSFEVNPCLWACRTVRYFFKEIRCNLVNVYHII